MQAQPIKIALSTLGCKVNHGETESMAKLLAEQGAAIVPFSEQADVYIINTCTVTQVADQKSRQMLSRARRLNPAAKIVAVGCLANLEGKTLLEKGLCDLCLESAARPHIAAHVFAIWGQENEKTAGEWDLPAFEGSRTRADLKVQDGCDRFCSYCIIPHARGVPRSRPVEACRAALLTLAEQGFCEVTLTGIQLAAWGEDLPGKPDVSDLLRVAGEIPGLRRLRLGSMEPQFITEALARACAQSPNLCPQFHLSLQSGSDTVLARMCRHYTTADYANAVQLLRLALPNCAITTDIIAGFPGETEAEHAETMAFVEKMGFSRIHVFPYSARRGTKAAEMTGQLPKAEKETRARALIALGDRLASRFAAAQQGQTVCVLIENKNEGYTEQYLRAHILGDFPQGSLVCGIISESNGATVLVRPV